MHKGGLGAYLNLACVPLRRLAELVHTLGGGECRTISKLYTGLAGNLHCMLLNVETNHFSFCSVKRDSVE